MKQERFWCTNPAAATARCKAEQPNEVAHTLETARQVCENTFLFTRHWDMERCTQPVVFEKEIDWNYQLNGDQEWLFQLNRHGFLVDLAKAFLYTGEQAYVDCFVRIVTDWIARAPLTEDSENAGTWRSLEAGLRCANWLRSMALLQEALPQSVADAMCESLQVHGDYLVRKSGDFQILSNWGVLQDEGLFLLGLAFEREDWRDLAIRRLCINMHWQVMDDGSHWEQSPMYHGEVLHCFLQVAAVARHCGVALPQEYTDGVHKMCTALAYWTMPGGVLPCQSDTDAIDARDLIAKGAILFADAELKAFAGGCLYEENIWDFDAAALDAYRALSTDVSFGSTALPDSGNYVMRTSASDTANALRFHSGCLGSGHGHADLLHVDLRAYGEDILVDCGRYTYVNTEERLRLKSVFAHNTMVVDGVPYTKPLDTWGYEALAQPLPCTHKFTQFADCVCGAHVGYLEQGGGVLVQRKALFLKPDVTVLFDVFYTQPNAQHTYAQYFHFAHTGKTTCLPEGSGVHFAGERAQAKVVTLSGGACTLSACDLSPRYNELAASQRFAVETTATGFSALVTVIATTPVSETLDLHAQLSPITMLRSKKTLPDSKAQGVVITLNGRSYTVIVCHGESISEVDMLCCNGNTGYGKMLVFGPETPQGICLAW